MFGTFFNRDGQEIVLKSRLFPTQQNFFAELELKHVLIPTQEEKGRELELKAMYIPTRNKKQFELEYKCKNGLYSYGDMTIILVNCHSNTTEERLMIRGIVIIEKKLANIIIRAPYS